MFFVLSKTVAALLLPSNFLILLGLAGVALLATRHRRAGLRMSVASLLLLAVGGFLPVGMLLGHALENRFPPWNPGRGAPDGIVVLGGAIDPAQSQARGTPLLGASAERVTIVAALARAYPKARIVFTGGNAALFPMAPAEADYVLPLWESFGIARDRVTLETSSRNTAENAAFTRTLVAPKPGERWLLVTSALHMPRAVGCFRRVGFPVEAYPVDWQTPPRLSLGGLVPPFEASRALRQLDQAAHEWVGLMAYWLTGRISHFLPGPMPAR